MPTPPLWHLTRWEPALTTPLQSWAASRRREYYSDLGGSASSRGGISWTPGGPLEVHGSWGQSIPAPDLGDLSEQSNGSVVETVSGAPTLFWDGGNPKLKVERARTQTLGLTFTSEESYPRIYASVNYFDILFKHRIQQGTFEPDVLTDPLYSSF